MDRKMHASRHLFRCAQGREENIRLEDEGLEDHKENLAVL